MLVFTISVPPPKCMELRVSVVLRLIPNHGNVSEASVWWRPPCYALGGPETVASSLPGGPEISKYFGYPKNAGFHPLPPPKCIELHVSVFQRLTPNPGDVSKASVWWWRPCYALVVAISPLGGPEISKYLGYARKCWFSPSQCPHPSVWNCVFQWF